MEKSIESICKVFWELEKKYALLDASINNVKFWQLIRFKTYRKIAEMLGVQEQAHTVMRLGQKIFLLFSYIKHSFTKNPFSSSQNEVIVVSHPRVKKVDDQYVDIYTHYFIQELLEANIRVLEIESPYLGHHLKKNTSYKIYTDFFILIKILFKHLVPCKLDKDAINLIQKTNQFLAESLEYPIDIRKSVQQECREFKILYWLYKILLKKIRPKVIYLVVSYGFMPIIKAAKDLNIEVIELQHGILDKYHLGYSFPDRDKALDYFPDKFLLWNEFWKTSMQFPLPPHSIGIKKFAHLEQYIEKYKTIEKKNQLVVLSQGNIGNLLAQLVLQNLKLFRNFKIVYKLHPGEYDRYHTYEALQKLSGIHPDIEIVQDVDLYQLLAESLYQIGVNSTALYEGLEFGCQTILFDTVGIEYMEQLIDVKNLKLFGDLYMHENTFKNLNEKI